MPQDIVKTTGPLKSANPNKGGGATKNVPVFGVVKDNIDPTRSGRIKVLIGDKSPQDSDNSSSWVTVSYMSNFFGQIAGAAGTGAEDHGTYKSNPSSYGEWHAPPDIGTKVICIFVNGDPNYGFYIGCVPEPETLQMVPAIGSSDKILANEGEAKGYGGATRLPVTNLNTNNKSAADAGTFNDTPRPVHSYTASIMNQQGIIRDPIRGPISSSASREPASRVGWGVSTPGRPIYEGGFDDSTIAQNLDPNKGQQLKVVARRGGHSIVMDDGDVIGRDQLIRIRTSLGHQILMSDDGQTLMILHSNGQSYIELGKEGTVDIFSTNSFNVRTQGDINFHADRNINLHAMENVNIQGKNIQTNSEEKTKIRAGSDINMAATGKITGLAGGAIAWGAGGDASLVAGGQAYVNGSKVNLNSGSPGTSPEAVSPIPLIAQTDTLYDQAKGFIAAPGKLLTIASRAPAHAPWANAGQGVDIKTSMNASSNLPAAPAPAAAATTTTAAQTTNPSPPATATVASAPSAVPPVSSAINNNVTATAVAQTATNAAAGPLATATQAGTTVTNAAGANVCAVGSFAMTPSQLELGGALKPGAATIINTMIEAGKTIAQAIPDSLFSGGVPGAQNLTGLIQNTTAQATTLVNTMQKAQSALTTIGAITGKEAPTQITGLVSAAATIGVGPVADTIKQVSNVVGSATSVINGVNSLTSAAGSPAAVTDKLANVAGTATSIVNKASSLVGSASSLTGSLSGSTSGAVGAATGALGQVSSALSSAEGVLKTIGQGDAAAQLSEAIGGLGGIKSALSAMSNAPNLSSLVDKAAGVATSAFNAIKDSFKDLEANVPQNLTAIAKEGAKAAATVANTVEGQGGLLDKVSAGMNSVSSLTGAVSSLANSATSIANAATSISKAIDNNSLSSIAGSVSSVSKTLTGAATAVTNTLNDITAVANTIPNSPIGSALNTATGFLDKAVTGVNAIAGAAPTLAAGGLPALSNAASVVQKGAAAASASALASGLSNLPGDIKTVASVVNNATGALNSIPGTAGLTNAIKDVSTAVLNGASALGSLDKLSSAVSGGNIAGALNGLTALASAGLPAGAAAQLQSAIASLSGGTPGAISLPSIGFNTTDRGSITAQITSLLGDPGIPQPNLVGEISEEAKQTIETSIEKIKEELDKANQELQKWIVTGTSLKLNYLKQRDLSGEDDITTQMARKAWQDLLKNPEFLAAEEAFVKAFNASEEAGLP